MSLNLTAKEQRLLAVVVREMNDIPNVSLFCSLYLRRRLSKLARAAVSPTLVDLQESAWSVRIQHSTTGKVAYPHVGYM
jgi:hypothetical protein